MRPSFRALSLLFLQREVSKWKLETAYRMKLSLSVVVLGSQMDKCVYLICMQMWLFQFLIFNFPFNFRRTAPHLAYLRAPNRFDGHKNRFQLGWIIQAKSWIANAATTTKRWSRNYPLYALFRRRGPTDAFEIRNLWTRDLSRKSFGLAIFYLSVSSYMFYFKLPPLSVPLNN